MSSWEPPPVRVLSYGGGLDSFAMLVDAIERGEPPDLCAFCDVADPAHEDPGEWPGTYRHIREVVEPLCAQHGIEFVTIDTESYPVRDARSLFAWMEERGQIPVTGPNRICTTIAKVERFEKWLDDRFPGLTVEVWVGFEAGEESRAAYDPNAGRKRALKPGQAIRKNRFPLIEQNLCRCRCQELVERLGQPVPRKSACTFCGYGSRGDWQTFARELPAHFARTVALEANKPLTKAGKKLSIMGYRTLPSGDYRAPPLHEYIQGTYKPKKVPCTVCGREQRATKATGCDYLSDAERPASAAVVIVQAEDKRIAAIRSEKRGRRVGFPGGKVDPGETPEAAAARELLEETGLVADEVVPLGQRDDGEHVTALFAIPRWHGQLRSSKEGDAFWTSSEDLRGPSAAFRDFNEWAIETWLAWSEQQTAA